MDQTTFYQMMHIQYGYSGKVHCLMTFSEARLPYGQKKYKFSLVKGSTTQSCITNLIIFISSSIQTSALATILKEHYKVHI